MAKIKHAKIYLHIYFSPLGHAVKIKHANISYVKKTLTHYRECITDYSTQAFTHWDETIPGKRKIKTQHEDAVQSLMVGGPGEVSPVSYHLGGCEKVSLATSTTSDFRILARSSFQMVHNGHPLYTLLLKYQVKRQVYSNCPWAGFRKMVLTPCVYSYQKDIHDCISDICTAGK